jgi:DNA-binding beta-propeller fold protein YncE
VKFSGDGVFLTSWGSFGTAEGQFASPSCIAVNRAGTVYVADTDNQRIQVFGYNPTSVESATWGRIKAIFR